MGCMVDKEEMENLNKLPLLRSIRKSGLTFPNRVVMSAMTRCRADYVKGIANELHAQYYSERAEGSAFVLTECSAIDPRGNSFPGSAGIYNDEQVKGWAEVVKAVHNKKGRIFAQIWHCGRVSRTDVLGGKPLAPSKITARQKVNTLTGAQLDADEPEELTVEGIKELVKLFRKAAENAKKAGFDGVELHGANGYIVDQFLRDASNKRTDNYGGSTENRCRFALEVIDELVDVYGKSNVGIKLSPVTRYGDMYDSDPVATYSYLLKELSKRSIGFIELVEPDRSGHSNHYGVGEAEQINDVAKTLRPFFNGIIVANYGFDFNSGNKIIQDGHADMVSFGKAFIGNPDLVKRFENNWEITPPDFSKAFTPGKEGYIDYPRHS